jgi:GTP-binding nuclear protein Ran
MYRATVHKICRSIYTDMPGQIKCVLMGDGCIGKSLFVHRLMNGSIVDRYTPTIGVEVHPIQIASNIFNVWDTAGQEKFGGLRDGYYMGADCAIIMATSTRNETIANINKWVEDFQYVCPGKPIVYVINGEKTKDTEKLPKDLVFYMNVKTDPIRTLKIPFVRLILETLE